MQSAATGNPPTSPPPAPRELEAHLLLEAALRLQAVQATWDNSKGDVDEALSYNRRLWSDFLDSVCEHRPALPNEVRQTIATLGLFVANQTSAIAADPRPERLTALIGINREIAAGLLGEG
ncbi:MAG: flagellar biosynthesis regulator FlaF [Rhodoplanes sp.]|uniref:flagellar biosynthesis regulator FlaF n=1 Tax=Rhodoplanes sp. TaxID=1968906 RepID=UPI00179419E3|nr:flagellar biosynthesis regulator FlaF [Rhodoplanes sp.]NVO15120.1 flagellar biosynthesis regulator FlaF [Rhodoplanes sp.]